MNPRDRRHPDPDVNPWAGIEKQPGQVDRLLRGFLAGFAGIVFLMVAAASEMCNYTIGGAPTDCMAVLSTPASLVVGLIGILAFAYGVRLSWRAIRSEPQ